MMYFHNNPGKHDGENRKFVPAPGATDNPHTKSSACVRGTTGTHGCTVQEAEDGACVRAVQVWADGLIMQYASVMFSGAEG